MAEQAHHPRVASPAETLGREVLPTVLTVMEVATLLRVSKQSIYRAIREGEIRGIQVRGRSVVPTKPLLQSLGWEDGHTPAGKP